MANLKTEINSENSKINGSPSPVLDAGTNGVENMPSKITSLQPKVTDKAVPSGINSRGFSVITPESPWPPPIYVAPDATPEELYYIEHRWHSQWGYYDQKAADAKTVYQRLQLMIAIGSVTVPVLVGISPSDNTAREALDILTVVVSLMVAASAAVENVKKYGDSWRSYRSAAEELKREKSHYDVKSGPYRRAKNAFLLFVERSEEIMAKQNGAWSALKEEQKEQQIEQNQRDQADGLEAG